MFRWTSFPLVRITLFFSAGVLLAVYRVLPLTHPWSIWAATGCTISFFVWRAFGFRSLRKWSGTLGLAAILFLGFAAVREHTATLREDHMSRANGTPDFYVARISSYPHEKEKTWRLSAQVEFVRVRGQWQTVSGEMYLYQSKTGQFQPYRYGDRLLVRGFPRPVEAPRNPGEFDYQRFLSFKNIFHQHFVTAEQIKRLDNKPANVFMAATFRARAWAEQQIELFVPGPREQAVANALVLGITDGLDNELTTAYAATGAMHVLAVSGLHVSIIYGLLLIVLRPFQRVRYGLGIQTAIALIALWLYAGVTGLSPSVLRAVTMFSFVVLAKPFRQRTNIYNTLAAAACCLLLYDPYMIMSVGFQLSFLAVVGIVYLQPWIYSGWEPKSKLMDWIWQVSCVSMAAQLATFALGLLYFHQFPNYFLFSNLVVIPGSFVVLVGGLALLVAAPVSWLATAFGWLLQKLIWLLNEFVLWVESWPFSLSENWYITTWQCWVLIAAAVCMILLVRNRDIRWLYGATLAVLLFAAGNWQRFYSEIRHDRLIVYHVNRHTAYDFFSFGNAHQFVDDALQNNREVFRFHIQPARLRAAVRAPSPLAEHPAVALRAGVRYIVWNGKFIAHIVKKEFTLSRMDKLDWLIVSQNALRDLDQLPPGLSVAGLILDSSCSRATVENLTEQARVRGWRLHDVSQQAFQTQL